MVYEHHRVGTSSFEAIDDAPARRIVQRRIFRIHQCTNMTRINISLTTGGIGGGRRFKLDVSSYRIELNPPGITIGGMYFKLARVSRCRVFPNDFVAGLGRQFPSSRIVNVSGVLLSIVVELFDDRFAKDARTQITCGQSIKILLHFYAIAVVTARLSGVDVMIDDPALAGHQSLSSRSIERVSARVDRRVATVGVITPTASPVVGVGGCVEKLILIPIV